MQNDSLAFKIPSFMRQESYKFNATEESFSVYQELTAIAEEIEQCRTRNI